MRVKFRSISATSLSLSSTPTCFSFFLLVKARDDGQVTVDMGRPELNGPKVPTTLPTNADGIVLKEPIKVSF